MTDPEIEYQGLVSGDPAAVRAVAESLDGVLHDLVGVRADLQHAAALPNWSGGAATLFAAKVTGLREGLSVTRSAVVRARAATDLAASAQDLAVDHANYYIGFWRNRPAGLPALVEELFARLVNSYLIAVGRTYNQQLAVVHGFISGDEVDLEELDEETRKWVEEGMAKNREWLAGSDSSLGPLIPNTAATGDGRGLIPQGLGYDPATGLLAQGYYTKDGTSHLALIDEVTGKEVGDVQLGTYSRPDGDEPAPSHAGGVTVVGNQVYVTDDGKLHTYSLDAIRKATPGQPVPQSAPPQALDGGSYSAYKDGKLYLGDFKNSELHVYTQQQGRWVKTETIDTPKDSQGVLVRDDELVFSTSYTRHQDHSSLVVQDHEGNRDEYQLPSMAQGVVEIDGELVVTYESGAEEFDHPTSTSWWPFGRDDNEDLWANRHMTRTPLAALGLGEDYEVEPGTLGSAATELGGPASALKGVGAELDGVRLPAHVLGEVPQAAAVSKAVEKLLEAAGDSCRTGARAVAAVAELLRSSAQDYRRVDEHVDTGLRKMTSG